MTAPQTPTPGFPLSAESWNRDDSGNQTMLYTLKEKGWRKGEPILVNDKVVRIEYDGDREPIIAAVLQALTTPSDQGEEKPRSWNEVIQSDDFKALSTTPAPGSDGLLWLADSATRARIEALVTREAAEKRIAELNACAQEEADALATRATNAEAIAASWKDRADSFESKVAALKAALEGLLALPELVRQQEYLRGGIGTKTPDGMAILKALALKEGR